MNLSAIGWLSPARRAWPLVGLALAACTPEPETGPPGPEGPQGDPGVDGIQGPTGADGFATLIDAVALDRGSECAYGGTRYDIGLDNGDGGGTARDGVLQAGEVDESSTVCDALGAVSAWEVPGGAAGTATIKLAGGTGGTGAGGDGGDLDAYLFGTGGHVQAYTTGSVGTSFTGPPFGAFFGVEKLTIGAGQTVTPVMTGQGTGLSIAEGVVYTFTNNPAASFSDDHLYVNRSGVQYRITGLRIEATGTLIVPVDNGRQAIVTFENDVDNSGTITTPFSGTNRWPLIAVANHFFGDSSGRIELRGGDGTGQVTGGEGGWLALAANTDVDQVSSDVMNNAFGPGYCPYNYEDNTGGIYTSNVIEATPGALGTGQTAIAGAAVSVCASDEVQFTGNIFTIGRGAGAGGWIYLTAGEGGLVSTGTLDAHGGPGFGSLGGSGGNVYLQGASVTHSGTIVLHGTSVPTTQNCNTGACTGGTGGTAQLYAYGGALDFAGTVDLSGGDAFGSGSGTLADGGSGGNLYAYVYDGFDEILDSTVPAGSLTFGASIDQSGGNGGQSGGRGGYLAAAVYGGEGQWAQGQDVSFVGYASMDLSGGNGNSGGYGGEATLANGTGYWDLVSDGGEGGYSPTATTGAAVNNVPVDASGGDGVSGGGGFGGRFNVWARWAYPQPTGQAINRARIDLYGGNGAMGGGGGYAVIEGSGLVESSGALDAYGGDGSPDSPGTGGQGGNVNVVSQHDRAGIHGAIEYGAGSGFNSPSYGGSGLFGGSETDVSANISAPGGDANLGTGVGGLGGSIDVWSSDTFSVVTGTLSSPGGAGATTYGGGHIAVDGFVEQAQGFVP